MRPTFAMRAASLVATGALLTAVAAAQSFSGEVIVNDGPSGTRQLSPTIQVAGDGTLYVAWIDERNGRGEIAMATSNDGGATFSPSRIVFPGRSALAGMQRGAQFVVDRGGAIHMTWQERTRLGKVSAMYARSLDGGLTFSEPIFASQDSGRYNQDFPSIAVDSSDNVSIAWVDDRDVELGTSTYTQLYYVRSSDRGATFSTPVVASAMPGGIGGSCECCNTAIATARDGSVFIAFRGNIANQRDVHVARTRDGGATFDVVRMASGSWFVPACPMTGSSIAVGADGTAHVAWRDARQSSGGRDIVYHATLGLDATTAGIDQSVSDSPKRTNFPSLVVTPSGAIVIAWQDTRTDASDIHVTQSIDGGATFAASRTLTAGSARARQEVVMLAIAPDGARYAAWQDTRRDIGDIFVSRDTTTPGVAGAPATAAASRLRAALASYVAAGEHTTLTIELAHGATVRVTIVDAAGRVVSRALDGTLSAGVERIAITTPGATGVYFCRIVAGDETRVLPMVVR